MLVKFCQNLLKNRNSNADARDPATKQRADEFFTDLEKYTSRVGPITYAFHDSNQTVTAHIQLHRRGSDVEIHRVWSVVPRQGHGSAALKKVCELADLHGVILKLTVNPLGVAPYPMSSNQLRDWYIRNGFEGGRKMIRAPRHNQKNLNRRGAETQRRI